MKHKISTRQFAFAGAAIAAVICLAFLSLLQCSRHSGLPQDLILSGIPQIPDSIGKSISRYQNWNFCAFQDWTADGKSMIIVSRCGQTNQVHVVDTINGRPRQLTFFSEPVTSVSACPDPARRVFLFTKDSGGNENFQIYVAGLDGGQPRLLTDGKGSQNSGALWSNAGDRFAYESNSRNGTDFDIYISDMKTSRPVLSRTGSWSCIDWSPDDQRLLVSRYHSRTGSFIAILDLSNGQITPLSDTTDTISQESAVWAKDGRGIFLTSDEGSLFRTLRYYDCATRHQAELTGKIPWDVREISMSRDRSHLAFMTNDNGWSRLYVMNTATCVYGEIKGLPQGGIYHLRFDAKAERLGMTMNLPQHPEECYAFRLADFTLVRWTKSPLGGLETEALTVPQLIQYPTFDSVDGSPRKVPCFYYRPRRGEGPFPVLVMVHGGPESQFWPYFSPYLQYFVNELGIAVLAPNIRGSGGFGRRYLELDNGYKREGAIRDIGCLLDWICRQSSLDSLRVAIMGGSYGGYVALASMAQFGNRIACGLDQYGISNFVTFLEHTSGYRRDLRRVEYGDERDSAMRAFLNAISPLTMASRIAKPLFIIQGANDPRVPLEESKQIAAAVEKNKSPVWMLVAADEGHGFRKKVNSDYQECAEAFFLQTFLAKGKRPAETAGR